MEDVRPLQLGPPALGEAVGGIRGHPPKRDPVRDGFADHRLGHGHFRLEADLVVDAGPARPTSTTCRISQSLRYARANDRTFPQVGRQARS